MNHTDLLDKITCFVVEDNPRRETSSIFLHASKQKEISMKHLSTSEIVRESLSSVASSKVFLNTECCSVQESSRNNSVCIVHSLSNQHLNSGACHKRCGSPVVWNGSITLENELLVESWPDQAASRGGHKRIEHWWGEHLTVLLDIAVQWAYEFFCEIVEESDMARRACTAVYIQGI